MFDEFKTLQSLLAEIEVVMIISDPATSPWEVSMETCSAVVTCHSNFDNKRNLGSRCFHKSNWERDVLYGGFRGLEGSHNLRLVSLRGCLNTGRRSDVWHVSIGALRIKIITYVFCTMWEEDVPCLIILLICIPRLKVTHESGQLK